MTIIKQLWSIISILVCCTSGNQFVHMLYLLCLVLCIDIWLVSRFALEVLATQDGLDVYSFIRFMITVFTKSSMVQACEFLRMFVLWMYVVYLINKSQLHIVVMEYRIHMLRKFHNFCFLVNDGDGWIIHPLSWLLMFEFSDSVL